MILSSVKNRSKSHFIITNGELLYKDNSLIFKSDSKEERIPFYGIDELYILSHVHLDTKVLSVLSRENITLHIFQQNYFRGTFQPFSEERILKDGNILVEQVKTLLNSRKRLFIAKSFIVGSLHNSANNCERFGIKFFREKPLEFIKNSENIEQLMGFEGYFKKGYYQCWNHIINNQREFNFVERSKRPPRDNINSLISYLNTRVYTVTLHEIFKTKLDPRVSFLHETNEREFSLHLDIAEIFKPIIADNIIFELLNSRLIDASDFDSNFRFSRDGIKKVEIQIAKKLSETFDGISWRDRIRIEVNKLRAYIEGGETYKPFVY